MRGCSELACAATTLLTMLVFNCRYVVFFFLPFFNHAHMLGFLHRDLPKRGERTVEAAPAA